MSNICRPDRTLDITGGWPDGFRCWFREVNYESALKVEKRNNKAIILKAPSRRCWVGRGDYVTSSPILIICKIESPSVLKPDIKRESISVTVIEEIEYNRTTRKESYSKALKIFEGV